MPYYFTLLLIGNHHTGWSGRLYVNRSSKFRLEWKPKLRSGSPVGENPIVIGFHRQLLELSAVTK